MNRLFIEILNMSISASFVAAIVMLIRLFIRKAPKKYSYILWAVVFFRLICPYTIHLPVSVMPVQSNTIPQDIVYTSNPSIQSGLTGVDNAINGFIDNVLSSADPVNSVNPVQVVLKIASLIWLAGFLMFLLYLAVSYLRLNKRVSTAIRIHDNIFGTDLIKSPFVFGFVHPRIYIPLGFDEQKTSHILMHEQTHIKRLDYLVKPLAFLVLAVHWFNPFAWASFALMAEDMELSADEAVINRSDIDIRGDYSNSLLAFAFSEKRNGFLSPLAFGKQAWLKGL